MLKANHLNFKINYAHLWNKAWNSHFQHTASSQLQAEDATSFSMKVKCNEKLTWKTFYALLCSLRSKMTEVCLTNSLEKQLWLVVLISWISNRSIRSLLQPEACIKINKETNVKNLMQYFRQKENVTFPPICWNRKWNKSYQLSTWMLFYPEVTDESSLWKWHLMTMHTLIFLPVG